jgi:hypothetical protein
LLSDNCKSLGRVHVGASWPPAWSAHAATAAAMHCQHPGCAIECGYTEKFCDEFDFLGSHHFSTNSCLLRLFGR